MKATIKAGCGHWDVTRYPLGGDFHRSKQDIVLTGAEIIECATPGATYGGGSSRYVFGTDDKGRKLAASVEVCEIIPEESELPTLASFKGCIAPEPGKSAEQMLEDERRGQWPDQDIGPLPLELLSEYDGAARWCAIKGLKGVPGDALPDNMDSDGALRWINADPEAFQERVRQFAYARAMERVNVGS